LFETGLCVMVAACVGAAGTLSRPRMLAAATPASRKQVSAMQVITLVKPFSGAVRDPRLLSLKLGNN
jgi:hypothetical protein